MNIFPNLSPNSNTNTNSPNPRDIQNPMVFTAEVVDVILSESHLDFSKCPRIGSIKFRSYRDYRVPGSSIVTFALPLDSNIIKPPLIGEFVIIIKSVNGNVKDKLHLREATSYYINTVSTGTRATNNIFDDSLTYVKDNSVKASENKTFDTQLVKTGSIYQKASTTIHEGFVVYEGRFGQSIIQGASSKERPDGIGSILGGNNGDPFTVIRTGNKSKIPNIKSDATSMYMLSNQRIIIQDSSFDSILGGWTTLNLDNVDALVQEVVMEDIQDKESISADPRAEFTDPAESITPIEISHNSDEGVPVYNQGDPRWGNLKANSETYTMRQAGCAMCSMAMVLRYLTSVDAITPELLFNVKKVVLVHWSDIIAFVNSKYNTALTPLTFIMNPKDMTIADRALASGIPILFESKNRDKPRSGETYKNNILEATSSNQKPYVGGKQHWMVITSKNADGTYNLNDPNGGRVRKKQSASDILNKVGRFGFINFKP